MALMSNSPRLIALAAKLSATIYELVRLCVRVCMCAVLKNVLCKCFCDCTAIMCLGVQLKSIFCSHNEKQYSWELIVS